MKLLFSVFTILIFAVTFSAKASFAFEKQPELQLDQKQEFKKVKSSGTSAAFLERSRITSPVHSQTLPISAPALFNFISSASFQRFNSDNFYQKKIKMLRQRWLWQILFPFHSFY